MAKGVKKIKMTEGLYYSEKLMLSERVTIKPGQNAGFDVIEWIAGTTEEDKKKVLTWMRQSSDRKVIVAQVKSTTGYFFNISKKLCGPYTFYIEASLSGKRDFKNNPGIYVNGYTEPLIKASDWRRTPDGVDIKNGTPIKYGELVYIWLDTEGLNGSSVTIEVYNQALGSDNYVDRFTNVLIKDGEVAYRMANTSKWRSKVGYWKEGIEEFYIKVKYGNTYLKDHLGDKNHAIYLGIENKVVMQEVAVSENITPTKVFSPEVNAKRHEPCKFDEIIVTIPKTKPIPIFKNGQSLNPDQKLTNKGTDEKINRTVYFEFNDYSIAPNAQKILNNILGFLLEHKGTRMYMSGYACVIGPEDYNQKLSQQRSDAVKNFFVSGGLDGNRIVSKGLGEYNIQSPDDYSHRNEKVYNNARRVDISFSFARHDANAVIFETIAPSSPEDITVEVKGFEVKDCYRDTKKHKKEILVQSPDIKAVDIPKQGSKVTFPIQSTLSEYNLAPLNYIWPKKKIVKENGDSVTLWVDSAALYKVHIHSCRYYTLKKNPALLIKAYPNIEWNLLFSIKSDSPLAYKHANIPPGNIYKTHQELARKTGYNKWYVGKHGKARLELGLGLGAKWDSNEWEIGVEWKKKFESLASVFQKAYKMADKVKNGAGGKMKKSSVPVGFEIMSPAVEAAINWKLVKPKNSPRVAVEGKLDFKASPLLGAKLIIDLLGALSNLNPAAKIIYVSLNTLVDDLGQYITFTLEFYGQLDVEFNALKINSITGADGGETMIKGKMGVKLALKLKIETKREVFGISIKAGFEAEAEADAYFGGDFKIDGDNKGIYIEPVLKFSGLLVKAKLTGYIGKFKRTIKLEDKNGKPIEVVDSEKWPFDKKYLI